MTFDYKKPISDNLKKYFDKYTTPDDVSWVVSQQHIEVRFHTLRRLRLGENNVANKKNAVAITELLRRAISNAAKLKEQATKHEKTMKNNLIEILNCI